jgi:hypothetical protein
MTAYRFSQTEAYLVFVEINVLIQRSPENCTAFFMVRPEQRLHFDVINSPLAKQWLQQ